MKKTTWLLIGLLIVTASCQSTPAPVLPTPTAIPPTATPLLPTPEPPHGDYGSTVYHHNV
jgi:hypothetical protein